MKREKEFVNGEEVSRHKKPSHAYDEYMNDFSKTAIRQNSTMTYKNFGRILFTRL